MSAVRVVRPVVRSFQVSYAAAAAVHVRAGGHALVWEGKTRVRLVFRVPRGDEEKDLGYWSLLDLGAQRDRDAAEARVPERVDLLCDERSLRLTRRQRALALRVAVREHRRRLDLVGTSDATGLPPDELARVWWYRRLRGRRHVRRQISPRLDQ